MKIKKMMAALLAVVLLAALAACTAGTDKQLADNKAKITTAEVEKIWRSLCFAYKDCTEAEALNTLIYQRVYVWEADSLGLLPDIEEAHQQVRQNYETIQAGAAAGNPEQNPGAQEAWGVLQEYLAYTGFSEAEYLEMAAETWQVLEAAGILRERVYAELSPAADEWEKNLAFGEYGEALIEKYKDCLVEDDLLPLLTDALTDEVTISYE